MRQRVFLALVLCAMALPGWAALDRSPRPLARPSEAPVIPVQSEDKAQGLADWIAEFRGRALDAGLRPDVLDKALVGLRYDAKVIQRDRNQSEFTKTIWDYLDTATSELRVTNGRRALDKHKTLLTEIEAKYGVPATVVTAVWGLESAYGTFRGSDPVIRSLATLAYDGRRGAFFEAQLIAALRILQAGDTTVNRMTGSWAGAMGHTQFIPTSYLDLAVDHDGDGKRDIWGDDPTDALASTAAYLANAGWVTGQPWGVEVILPEGFDVGQTGMPNKKPPAYWAEQGVRDIAGNVVPDHGPAAILLPGGHKGAAFLIFRNFNVIERYNTADAYVIAVGHLSDRIAGGPPIQSDWPRQYRALTLNERLAMQRALTARGHDTQGIDGKIGPNTIAAIRSFQRSESVLPDGFASTDILERLDIAN